LAIIIDVGDDLGRSNAYPDREQVVVPRHRALCAVTLRLS